MTELVPDHALQLIPVERRQCTTCHCHHGIGRTGPRRKGIDAWLGIEHEQRGNRHIGCQCHFLNDIGSASFKRVIGAGMHQPASQRCGDLAAAASEVDPVHQHHGTDHQGDDPAHSEELLPADEVGSQARRPGFA